MPFQLDESIRTQAYRIYRKALKDGKLKRRGCRDCGKLRAIHGHHDDYRKPLKVVWLCAKHHQDRHQWLEARGWIGDGVPKVGNQTVLIPPKDVRRTEMKRKRNREFLANWQGREA